IVADHPIEDMYGDEIRTGDKYFIDDAGRVVLQDNVSDYLMDQCGVVFYETEYSPLRQTADFGLLGTYSLSVYPESPPIFKGGENIASRSIQKRIEHGPIRMA